MKFKSNHVVSHRNKQKTETTWRGYEENMIVLKGFGKPVYFKTRLVYNRFRNKKLVVDVFVIPFLFEIHHWRNLYRMATIAASLSGEYVTFQTNVEALASVTEEACVHLHRNNME